MPRIRPYSLFIPLALLALAEPAFANGNVHVSRFWHNHQPLYWPEWNTNGGQTNRGEYAWDSISLKFNRSYAGSSSNHPENNLGDIFGKADRVAAYQGNPKAVLQNMDNRAGFAMSYSGSLIDNVRQLGAGGHLGYGSGWNSDNTTARQWTTPSGSPRLDMLGFTNHHSLGPLLPKEVMRKEIQVFKQAWWKAWGGNADLSDHSKGFFPTEMAYSRHIVDVLVDEGFEWVLVASHHISRTCPTYFDQFDIENGNYGIFSSPPNKADLIGPSPTSGWWYAEPNPGNAAWNVAPYAYQLHRVKYVDPETGNEKSMIAVPSDDVLSYRYGYSNAGIGDINTHIAPYATDPNRPVLVMPSTDGDNAWGGGNDSWFNATPQLFGDSANAGYVPTTPQDFVNAHGAAAPMAHIEDGAWIFPESCYGSPYFLKWIEPPVAAPNSTTRVPNTKIDMESPGFALKFWAWAPVITGANWVETAEQIARDENWEVRPWVIQAPYDWGDGDIPSWDPGPNDVELAWHIYLKGLDSGFNYYGGLGNDDEVKAALATTRAIQKLQPWMTQTRRDNDRTPPSVLKPQRFPYNPGGYTFGWFNPTEEDGNFLKKMASEFYIWTHAYDLSGVTSVNLKIRIDNDGTNPLASNDNEVYNPGDNDEVGNWITIPMTKRVLPNDQASLNAAANNGEINYFISPPELADYYFAKITNANVAGFRDKLLDYYIEATDGKNNVHKSEIQHVYVEDDGAVTEPPATPTAPQANVTSSSQIDLSWSPATNASGYFVFRDGNNIATVNTTSYSDTALSAETTFSYTIQAFNNAGNSALSPATDASTPAAPDAPDAPTSLSASALSSSAIVLNWNASTGATEYRVSRGGSEIGTTGSTSFTDSGLGPLASYTYTVVAGNEGGYSSPSDPASATTQAAPPSFSVGEDADPTGYLLEDPGMRIFAAVRGTLLYVATWTPSGGVNDHYILVSDSLEGSATSPAPWGKAGTTAQPVGKPFIGAEADNQYAGWFNVSGDPQVWRDGVGGGRVEGVIDLVETFGNLPEMVYISALAYGTADGAALASQAPDGDSDGNVDPDEFLAVPVAALQDSAANGTFDRLDPARDFQVAPDLSGNDPAVKWPAVPGRSYNVWRRSSLGTGDWEKLNQNPITAASGDDELQYDDTTASGAANFYRVEWIEE